LVSSRDYLVLVLVLGGTGTGRQLEAVEQVEIVSPQVCSVPSDGHT